MRASANTLNYFLIAKIALHDVGQLFGGKKNKNINISEMVTAGVKCVVEISRF